MAVHGLKVDHFVILHNCQVAKHLEVHTHTWSNPKTFDGELIFYTQNIFGKNLFFSEMRVCFGS